ncbi:hypothetical protein [Novosphingobium sp.]|uniref:hypothetical protein n=1 Tax=Novosphingobium sp. TaxID=1874826 RepID=UPI00352ABEDC
MSDRLKKHTVYLTDGIWQQLTREAVARGQNPSEFMRAAVEQHLTFHSGRGANPNRVAELAEFNQLVLDQILRRDFPDLREQVLDAVDKRLGKFHGR